MGDAEAEGASRKCRAAFNGEEEDDAVAQIFHETVLSGKLRQAVRRVTDREGGGCLLPEEKCTKTGRLVAEVLREEHPYMCVFPMEIPRAQPLRSMRMYQKRYPSTSQRMTSRGSHQRTPAHQVH